MTYWRWKCLNPTCNREFVKEAGYIINMTCRYCHEDKYGFLKIKDQDTKNG